MPTPNPSDKVAAILGITRGYESELRITFANLSDMTIKQAWERLQLVLSLSDPTQFLQEVEARGVRFRDCTVAEATSSLLRQNRWGLSKKVWLLLKHRGVFSMRIVQAMSDAELRDLYNVGKKTIDEIRAAQAHYESGER